MLEIGTIKVIADLFKDIIEFVDKSHEQKRRLFDNTVSPLFEKLEDVANEYYSIIRYARSRLLVIQKVDKDELVEELKEKRAAIVLVRNKILGTSKSFTVYSGHFLRGRDLYEQDKQKVNDFYAQLHVFSESIILLFSSASALDDDTGGVSSLTSIIEHIQSSDCISDGHVQTCDQCIEDFERRWKAVSTSFGHLKILSKSKM